LWGEAVARHFAPEPQREPAAARRAAFRARMQMALDTYDPQKAAALFALLKANHTWLCPTLTAQRNSAGPPLSTDPRLKYVSPANRKWWNESPYWLPKDRSPEDDAMRERVHEKYIGIVAAAQRAGVGLLAGTTGEEPYFNVPGFGLHDELAMLVQAGLTPLEALQAATLNPARFLRKEEDLGTIAPGKFADLVLLNANPLQDISNTHKIAAVVYRGKLYSRALLDTMLAKIAVLADRKSIADLLAPIVTEKRVDAAIQQYHEMKSSEPASYDFNDKYELQSLGNQLLYANKLAEAIRIQLER